MSLTQFKGRVVFPCCRGPKEHSAGTSPPNPKYIEAKRETAGVVNLQQDANSIARLNSAK